MRASSIWVLAVLAIVCGASGTQAQTTSGFDGFYVGAHGGYGKVDYEGSAEIDGGLGGLHAGFNHITGSVLLGLEGDVDWSDVSFRRHMIGSGYTYDVEGGVNYFASFRLRMGWLYDSKTLVFATGGFSWSELESEFVYSTGGVSKFNARADGPVLGGGAEYMLSNALSARIEGLHYWGRNDEEFEDGGIETNVVRAGVSYYFK